MLSKIIYFSIRNKFIIILFTLGILGFGIYSVSQLSIGAVPDITNNQVQVITTSRNLSTQDIEQFITYPVELEMANLPGVKEIRSVSKFGLSVVTIVFNDDMGTYLPRQLIGEKIKSASEKIPEGFGTPEMGPITTGLGEIYQYILDVKPEYEGQYTATDLRTIQDWVVKRQLSGIPGVVEVNTWGGYLKQYEVAINSEKLLAMDISVQEVFTALQKNNSVAGGGYIEKVNQAYFIRGEGLVGNINDINNIVVKTQNSIPIYVKDLAQVGFGSATRFGAITANGEGEKVLGQVMMLKDANSNDVINSVKQRVAEISKTLPEGVYINPFLERSELIGKTMLTVSENLILGCLIVIFVVVLLLGNIRSGLVVASVIPLSLFFALSLMYIFGVDANLMSLGAIDFGIIIDGAVIIVEFISFQISQKSQEVNALEKNKQQSLKDEITFNGASKMMSSAIFGQLIILIVFIPILSLSGVEGKMFKPMAMVFSFALIGAMLMCFTYVPVMSSLFLKPSQPSNKNISVRFMRFLDTIYAPTIHWAMEYKKIVLGIAVALLVVTVLIFSRMGGEFVPTLDEGDFVIQPVLKTGTSLKKTIETTTKIESILKENFPEVKQVVSRIGAAEVPTDPMSMEESDVIITLNPKSEWTSAKTKDELANKFKDALAIIPGMEVEFTQPIEMRFNELITGVRADIAIKVFGEDLNILAKKGEDIKKLIEDIEGVGDLTVEKIAGLPQMNVKYNRDKIARYGLNIENVNQVLSMGFAGKPVGQIFEGEKRFDMVVRLDAAHRKNIDNIKNLYIDLPQGGKVPLNELAEISYQKGAAKISRDDTRRRIVVGINVRNRDLQSVVNDVQQRINENITLPTGYYISYGGQFENLQSASKRLMIAVPIALLLIFIMLYFAFQSAKEALIIYSAIPFSAVGGVLLLWLRDLPFSISAGVGFIALFGIAVLNGIVLIEHFKEMKSKQYNDIEELIKQGAKDRLRAVLLTAMAAALGFLPMAVSTGAGAEVQRPLATVVVGGLITSTLLTLIVLPVLYATFHRKLKFKMNNKIAVLLIFGLTSIGVQAQEKLFTLDDLITVGLENNSGIQAKKLQIKQSETLENTAVNLPKTDFYVGRDENNLAANNQPLNALGVRQTVALPTVYKSNKKVKQAETERAGKVLSVEERKLKKEITLLYYQYMAELEKADLFENLDSLYAQFSHRAKRRFELGETNYLEKITARVKQKQISLDYKQANINTKITYKKILKTIQFKDSLQIETLPLTKLKIKRIALDSIPELTLYEQENLILDAQKKYEKKKILPELNVDIFNGINSDYVKPGFLVGVAVPLFGNKSYSAKIKALEIDKEINEKNRKNAANQLRKKYETLLLNLNKYEQNLQFYEAEGKQLSDEIVKTANRSLLHGEIDFFRYIQSMENAYQIKIDYLKQLQLYNETIIHLNYLTF